MSKTTANLPKSPALASASDSDYTPSPGFLALIAKSMISQRTPYKRRGPPQAPGPGHPDFVGVSQWRLSNGYETMTVLQLPDFRRFITIHNRDTGEVVLQGEHQAKPGMSMVLSLRTVRALALPVPPQALLEYDDPFKHFNSHGNPLPSATEAHKQAVARVRDESA